MVKTDNDGNVRSFAMTANDFTQVNRHSNMQFDLLLDIKLLHDQQRRSIQGRISKSLIMQHKTQEVLSDPAFFKNYRPLMLEMDSCLIAYTTST